MASLVAPDREIRDQLAAKHYPHIMPLENFPEPFLDRIMGQVYQDTPPPRWRVGETFRLPSRGHLEWHLFRGMDPQRRGRMDPAIRNAVIRRDGYVCGICSDPVEPDDVHLEHIIPYSRGGPTTIENLRVTHSACNLRKGAAWPESA